MPVVVTNLDDGSPIGYRHMRSVIDVTICSEVPTDGEVLKGIGRNATAEAKLLSWDALTERLVSSDQNGISRLVSGSAEEPALTVSPSPAVDPETVVVRLPLLESLGVVRGGRLCDRPRSHPKPPAMSFLISVADLR